MVIYIRYHVRLFIKNSALTSLFCFYNRVLYGYLFLVISFAHPAEVLCVANKNFNKLYCNMTKTFAQAKGSDVCLAKG